MLNWIRPSRRHTLSRSTSSSTGSRISIISCKSRSRGGASGGDIFSAGFLRRLERNILPHYLLRCRWFGGKARPIRSVRVVRGIDLSGGVVSLFIVTVRYRTGPAENYSLPLAVVSDLRPHIPFESVLCEWIQDGRKVFLIDGVYTPGWQEQVWKLITQRGQFRQGDIRLIGYSARGRNWREARCAAMPTARILQSDQSNTALVFGQRFYLKWFRRIEPGRQPDVEVTCYLSGRRRFPSVPMFVGALELAGLTREPVVLGLLQAYVPSRTDAWTYTTVRVARYFERILSTPAEDPRELAVPCLPAVRRLGGCTAELHRALSAETRQPDFLPERIGTTGLRALSQEMEERAEHGLDLLRDRYKGLPPAVRAEARAVLGAGEEIQGRLRSIRRIDPGFFQIRIHGDYHLGQVLLTARGEPVIVDFEGEPVRLLAERRRKQPAVRDIAGMLRSLHYAAQTARLTHKVSGCPAEEQRLAEAARQWYSTASRVFLHSYWERLEDVGLFPASRKDCRVLLEACWLDKAIYELGYELNHRPQWATIPLRGIGDLLSGSFDSEVWPAL